MKMAMFVLKSKILLIILSILLLCSCKSVQYKKLMEEAIELKPHKWDAYSLEINIYACWSQKSIDWSDNQEAVKEVYDRWLANGNSFNEIQEFAYANTLYTLGNYEAANKIYGKYFNYYSANIKKLSFTAKPKHQNEYLLQVLQELRQEKSYKKHIAKSLCNC